MTTGKGYLTTISYHNSAQHPYIFWTINNENLWPTSFEACHLITAWTNFHYQILINDCSRSAFGSIHIIKIKKTQLIILLYKCVSYKISKFSLYSNSMKHNHYSHSHWVGASLMFILCITNPTTIIFRAMQSQSHRGWPLWKCTYRKLPIFSNTFHSWKHLQLSWQGQTQCLENNEYALLVEVWTDLLAQLSILYQE